MKKALSLFFVSVFVVTNCYGVDITDWKRGDASIPVKGTDSVSDIDTLISNYIADPLDRVLTEHRKGANITWVSNATVSISAGEVVCYNSAKTIKRMRRTTSAITITLPTAGASGDSLDTGNAAASTWYYVYAVADADATTFTGICSTSASTPTGVAYFRYLGRFYNNASDNISAMSVENSSGETGLGDWTTTDIDAVTLADNTVYQAVTDGFVIANGNSSELLMYGYTDDSNPPTTQRAIGGGSSGNHYDTFFMPVKKDDYWKTSGADSYIYWIPLKHLEK